MYIDRKISTIIMVIDRIYRPKAQDAGTYISLENQIDGEMHLAPEFFINLIQITGNLVASPFKCTSSSGSIEVFFSLDIDQGKLNMAVKYTGKSIAYDMVSAFSEGKKVAKPTEAESEPCFAARLHHVMQIVSKENGRIFMNNSNDSETTFSLMLPVRGKYLNRRNGSHLHFETAGMTLNGS